MEQMKLAIPTTCAVSSHRYYRESGTATPCPFCLLRIVVQLRQRIKNIDELATVIKGETNAASTT